MKNAIILSVLIALSTTVTAQTDTVAGYKSIFGHESTEWNVALNYMDDYNWYNYIMRSSIDTSVNETKYKKIEIYSSAAWERDILLREDTTTGKVWLRCVGGDDWLEQRIGVTDTDFLIMDMSMEIGDSIFLFLSSMTFDLLWEDWFYVRCIDTINGHKTIHLQNEQNYTIDFIEGIGASNLFDVIEPWHFYSALVCCHKDGELIYHKTVPGHPDENCIIPYVGIENSAVESSVSVYPNPCSDWIRIEGDNIQSACLYDILGSVIMDNVDVHSPINLSSLPHGVYLLRVANGNTLLTKTIIKI